MLYYARLIEHNSAESRCVKAVQSVIVRNGDAMLYFSAVLALFHGDTNSAAFLYRLSRNGQRRKDQHIVACCSVDCIRPRKLHSALAQACVRKYSGSTTSKRPSNDAFLEVEKTIRKINA